MQGIFVCVCVCVCLKKLMPHCCLPFLHNDGLLFVFLCVFSMYLFLPLSICNEHYLICYFPIH